jgi:hypothetical protein
MDTSGTLKTDLGDVIYNVTQGDHVFCLGDRAGIVVNGVRINFSLHLNLRDGIWVESTQASLYGVRFDNGSPPPPAACRKIRETMIAAWTALLQKDEAGHLLMDAQLKHLSTEIARKLQKVQELENEASDLRDVVNSLRHEKEAILDRKELQPLNIE